MNQQENVKTIKGAYAAYERGDIPSILKILADDVSWQTFAPAKTLGPADVVPWSRVRRGRDQVKQFFKDLDDGVKFQKFEPREFIANGDHVVVLGSSKASLRSTDQIVDQEWVMVWILQNGKVISYKYYDNSATWVEAFRRAADSYLSEHKIAMN